MYVRSRRPTFSTSFMFHYLPRNWTAGDAASRSSIYCALVHWFLPLRNSTAQHNTIAHGVCLVVKMSQRSCVHEKRTFLWMLLALISKVWELLAKHTQIPAFTLKKVAMNSMNGEINWRAVSVDSAWNGTLANGPNFFFIGIIVCITHVGGIYNYFTSNWKTGYKVDGA